MRWKTKKISPKRGDIKYAIKFALLPTKMEDGVTIWLEKYIAKYEFLMTIWNNPEKWSRESDVWKEMYVELLK